MIKLHTLNELFNMCLSQEEKDVSTFQAIWEETMDDVIIYYSQQPPPIRYKDRLDTTQTSWVVGNIH